MYMFGIKILVGRRVRWKESKRQCCNEQREGEEGSYSPSTIPPWNYPQKGAGGANAASAHTNFSHFGSPPPPLPLFAIAGKFFCFGARGGEQEKGERKYKIMLHIEAK